MSGVSGRYALPRQRKNMVLRPQLNAQLHEAVGGGLIVLHAPAGYGKSAVIAAFTRELDFRVSWLSLDASCNSPEVFARQLVAAMSGDPAAEAPATAEKPDDLRAYVGSVARDVSARAESPMMLVIDNCHELRSSDGSAEVLGFLLESLPESAEVVLSGREVPQIIAVEKRVATGECLVLDRTQLAFTQAEVHEVAKRAGRRDGHAIFRATGGWPAAVMAAVSGTLQLERTVARSTGAWEQYLASEVWAAVPGNLRETFLSLSVPPALDREVGEMIAGRAAWEATVRWLQAHDFLFESLEGGGMRLNPVLREFLHSTARHDQPEQFTETSALVVEWLRSRGQLADAIELARDSMLTETLVALVVSEGDELLHAGQFALLSRACAGVPDEVAIANSALRAFRARVLAHSGRAAEALEESAAVMADEFAPGRVRMHAVLARIRALRLLGRASEIGESFAEARMLHGQDRDLDAQVAFHEAQWLLPTSSDFNQAERLLRSCIDSSVAVNNTTLELLARSTLGQVLAMRGECPAAVAELTRAALGWRQRGRTSNLGWVLNNLGMAHLSVGDFTSSIEVLNESVAEALSCENQRNLAYATGSLGDAQLAAGNFTAAEKHYEEAIRICAEEVSDETLASLAIAGYASAILGQGDLERADYFAVRALYITEQLGSPFEHAHCQLVHASVHSLAGRHREACALAAEAVAGFRSIDAGAPTRVALYRLALAQFRAGERANAAETLNSLGACTPDAWMVGALIPPMREHPMFAQWVAARGVLGDPFREVLRREAFGDEPDEPEVAVSRFPRVEAQSLGAVRVRVGGRDIPGEAWASTKSKEMFYLFLLHRDGLRKEQAVEHLYPDLDRAKCNSAFHSNLYRVRRALYQESVVHRDGAYVLNPDGDFEWDLERFEQLLEEARLAPAGSDERAELHTRALELYRGPFAEAFFSEWAESLRRRTEARAQEAIATLGGFYAGRGDFDEAARCMDDLLARNPANEEAAYQLAAYRARAGRPAGALASIDDFSRLLSREYGEALPERFRDLRSRIASGRAV